MATNNAGVLGPVAPSPKRPGKASTGVRRRQPARGVRAEHEARAHPDGEEGRRAIVNCSCWRAGSACGCAAYHHDNAVIGVAECVGDEYAARSSRRERRAAGRGRRRWAPIQPRGDRRSSWKPAHRPAGQSRGGRGGWRRCGLRPGSKLRVGVALRVDGGFTTHPEGADAPRPRDGSDEDQRRRDAPAASGIRGRHAPAPIGKDAEMRCLSRAVVVASFVTALAVPAALAQPRPGHAEPIAGTDDRGLVGGGRGGRHLSGIPGTSSVPATCS